MPTSPHIVLIGLRGCGKSTLAALLAEQVGMAFTDLDRLVSEQVGMDGAGAIIETHGIERFRKEETIALASALEQTPGVIALGGGTPTAPGAADLLSNDRTRVFYLRASVATLGDRLKNADNTDRPALVGDDPVSEIETLFGQRDEAYQKLAESIVHVDGISEKTALTALVSLTRAGV